MPPRDAARCTPGAERPGRSGPSVRFGSRFPGRALLLAASLALAACGAARSGGAGEVAQAPRGPEAATRVLRVGSSGDYPPFSVRDPSGEWTGFDVEVARANARDRGHTLELVPFRWPDLTDRFAAGDFDVVMSGVTVRGERLVRAPMT